MSTPRLGAFSHVAIGVANLDTALNFWQQNFGLQVRIDRQGPDAALGTLWDLDPQAITRQALVAMPTGPGLWATAGAVHLVALRDRFSPVRRGGRISDLLSTNLALCHSGVPAH